MLGLHLIKMHIEQILGNVLTDATKHKETIVLTSSCSLIREMHTGFIIRA